MNSASTDQRQRAVSVRELVKRFGSRVVLHHLSFDVALGETVVLWGPNGAGKTTVLRCVLGVIPFEGTIQVLGHDVQRQGKAARQRLGYVPQELSLHGEQTVSETVAFYAQLRRIPVADALRLLDRWQLGEATRQSVRSLSGGMKQKLALVVALLADPPILLLDEPTSNLDLRARRELGTMLERLKQEGKTIIFCSHRASEVWKLADRVIALDQGEKVCEGTPEQLRDQLPQLMNLGVSVAPTEKARALRILEERGFRVHPNGTYLWVEIPASRKIEPLQALTEARIAVLDFELDSSQSERAAQEGS